MVPSIDTDFFAEPTVIEPVSSAASTSGRSSTEPWQSSGPRFTALPTDEDGVSPQTAPATATHSRSDSSTRLGEPTYPQSHLSPLDNDIPQGQRPYATSAPNALAPYGAGHVLEGADPSGLNLDPTLLQTTIGSLLQSPAAAQMFLNSLNSSVQGQSLSTPSKVPPSPSVTGPNVNDPTLALFSPLPQQLVNNNHDLLGAYQKAAGVGGDVEKLQESIDSLVRSMGLDIPDHASNGTTTSASSAVPGGINHDHSLPSEGTFDDGEFNVDDLLDQLTKSNNDSGEEV